MASSKTPGTDDDQGTQFPQGVAIPSHRSPPGDEALPEGGHRSSRKPRSLRASPGRVAPPDLGVLAREAVVGFLREASAATAQREAGRAEEAVTAAESGVGHASDAAGILAEAEPSPPGEDAIAASRLAAESAAWRAAALSIATLDRIEATVASVEADIRAAQQAQADLQARAGAAAEAAVRAAQDSWLAANTAVEAHMGAKTALRKVEHYVSLTILLSILMIILLALGAIPLH
jgi:hypothetical protein